MRAIVQCGSVLIFAVLHGSATAQAAVASDPAPKKSTPHFVRLDTDKDGFLSYQEARADKEAAQNFALYDENRDGRLSEDEFLKLKAAQARHRGVACTSATPQSRAR